MVFRGRSINAISQKHESLESCLNWALIPLLNSCLFIKNTRDAAYLSFSIHRVRYGTARRWDAFYRCCNPWKRFVVNHYPMSKDFNSPDGFHGTVLSCVFNSRRRVGRCDNDECSKKKKRENLGASRAWGVPGTRQLCLVFMAAMTGPVSGHLSCASPDRSISPPADRVVCPLSRRLICVTRRGTRPATPQERPFSCRTARACWARCVAAGHPSESVTRSLRRREGPTSR